MDKRAGRPVLLIIGTRPETIKLAPLYQALQKRGLPVLICSTGQHAELLHSAFSIFGLQPDFDFQIMKPDQDLFHVTDQVLREAGQLFRKIDPALVVVQGDTTSALSAALAAFYLKIPVVHVEAGLRTKHIGAPFPEEMNRRVLSVLASHHYAPTPAAVERLRKEGVDPSRIHCTGNTVVDALYAIQRQIAEGKQRVTPAIAELLRTQNALGHQILLLTAHRRESLDAGLLQIFCAIKQTLQNHPRLFVLYPSHPNPAVRRAIQEAGLENWPQMQTILPLSYPDLIAALTAATCVATDSGGLQEEAISLGKPVVVLREETDRPEGAAQIVGTSEARIVAALDALLREPPPRQSGPSPFGDGHASERIARHIATLLETE